MKLLHVSDLHIGKQVNEFPMLEDQRFILQRILDIIADRQVDALLIAGDIYDRSAPSAESVACADWFFSSVARTGAACFAIAGNHDSAERIAYGSSLFANQGVYLSPVYDGSIAKHTLEDEYGPVDFWLLPFLRPASVRHFFPDAAIETDYSAALSTVVASCDIDPSRRNVALSHQFVTFAGAETLRSDSELSLGGLDNVDARVFDAFDYVALGHIHRPQRIGRDTVRYSGSPLKYSASEIRYPKSAPLVTLNEKGSVDIELIPLAPLHDMREIRGPLAELTANDVVSGLSAAERSDYIFAVLTDALPPIDALSSLRAVYPNVMAISYDNARTQADSPASRAQGPDIDNIESIDPLDLFARFYEERNGEPMTPAQTELARKALEENGA